MSGPQTHTPLPGSERISLPGARQVGAVAAHEPLEVNVYLKARSPTKPATALEGKAPLDCPHLSRREFAEQAGADPAAIAQVEAFAHAYDRTIVEVNLACRVVVLAGTAATLQTAFGVALQRYEHRGGHYRGRTGSVQVPAELLPIIAGGFGLDNRPQAQTHYRHLDGKATPRANTTSYTPPQVAQLYDFPTHLHGQGQSIALIELGGG